MLETYTQIVGMCNRTAPAADVLGQMAELIGFVDGAHQRPPIAASSFQRQHRTPAACKSL
jgi:hypothetical protein